MRKFNENEVKKTAFADRDHVFCRVFGCDDKAFLCYDRTGG